jgi:hypothetical protein
MAYVPLNFGYRMSVFPNLLIQFCTYDHYRHGKDRVADTLDGAMTDPGLWPSANNGTRYSSK